MGRLDAQEEPPLFNADHVDALDEPLPASRRGMNVNACGKRGGGGGGGGVRSMFSLHLPPQSQAAAKGPRGGKPAALGSRIGNSSMRGGLQRSRGTICFPRRG